MIAKVDSFLFQFLLLQTISCGVSVKGYSALAVDDSVPGQLCTGREVF